MDPMVGDIYTVDPVAWVGFRVPRRITMVTERDVYYVMDHGNNYTSNSSTSLTSFRHYVKSGIWKHQALSYPEGI